MFGDAWMELGMMKSLVEEVITRGNLSIGLHRLCRSYIHVGVIKWRRAQEIANAISVPIIRLLNSVYSGLFGQIQILRSPRIRFWNNLRCGTNIFRTHPIYRLFLSVDPIKFSEFATGLPCV